MADTKVDQHHMADNDGASCWCNIDRSRNTRPQREKKSRRRNRKRFPLNGLLTWALYSSSRLAIVNAFTFRCSLGRSFVRTSCLSVSGRPEANKNDLYLAPSSSGENWLSFTMPQQRNMTTTEMVATSITGTVLTVGILYTLAMDSDVPFSSTTSPATATMERLELAGYNIIDAALPLTATDVVSVAVGEAIAGVIGAAASLGISKLSRVATVASSSAATTTSLFKVSDAVADGDFLLTNAAAFPLLEAIGLPLPLAIVVSTAISLVPYEIVKVGAKRRERLVQEDLLLQQLLAEEQRRKASNPFQFLWKSKENDISSLPAKTTQPSLPVMGKTVDPSTLKPVQDENEKFPLDPVETFSDILKWLQYGILSSDYTGNLVLWNGQRLDPGLESATYGIIAGISAQVYADILYAYFGFGGDAKRDSVRNRSLLDWWKEYAPRFVYFGVLFYVYQVVQAPAENIVDSIFSGGLEACLGSNDFGACVDTYVENNPPPGPTPDAQLRAFITAAASLWSNLFGNLPFSNGDNWFSSL